MKIDQSTEARPQEGFLITELEKYVKRIPSILVFSFIASFIIIFLIHGYCFTNYLTNYDNALISNGAGGIIENGGAVTSGRFLLTSINAISSRYTMPWINGLLSSVYFSLTICILVSLFEIRHRSIVVLMAALMASFPSSASTFSFMYTADAYFFAMMISALAALVTRKYRFGFIPGALLAASALGIYQAYFPFTAALLVFSLLFTYLRESRSVKAMVFECMKAFVSLAAGLVLYKVLLDAALELSGKQLSSYIGIDQMWYISPWDLAQRLSDAYRYSFLVYKANPFFHDAVHILYLIELAALSVLAIIHIIRKRIYAEPVRLFIIILLIAVSPLACSLIFVMSQSVHSVMIYGAAVPLAVGAAALDRVKTDHGRSKAAALGLSALLLFSLVGICFYNTILVNKAYLKLDMVYESAYAFCTKLTARMEMTENYEVGMPVVLVGSLSEENRPPLNPEMDELNQMAGITTELKILRTNIISGFCRYYIGDQIAEATEEQHLAVLENPEVETMPIYPYSGSIRIIDGVMVVKLGE